MKDYQGMDADDYQAAAMRTAGPALAEEDGLLLSVLGLCGEAGECADLVKKHLYHGHPLHAAELQKEAGDVAWYLARLCQHMGWCLSDVLRANIAKLESRYPGGFSEARSLHREEVER